MVKKIVLSVIFLSFLSCYVNVGGNEREQFKQSSTKRIQLRNLERLNVETQNGSIRVYGWDSNYVKISYIKFVKAENKKKAKEFFNNMKIFTEIKNKELFLKTRIPRSVSGGIDFKIFTPQEVSVYAEAKNGSVDIKKLKGSIEVNTYNGSVKIYNVLSDALQCLTRNGSIKIKIDTFLTPSVMKLKSYNGSVIASFPHNSELNIYAKAYNGKILSDFPVYTKEEKMKGKIKISLVTYNGVIIIKEKE